MWLKIKVWTKAILGSLLLLYALVFLLKNSDETARIWYWPLKEKYQIALLFLVFFVFLAGVVGTILVRTTFKTIWQIRELQRRSRAQRFERDLADMKSKAAMLKTREPHEARETPSGYASTDSTATATGPDDVPPD